MQRNTSLWKLPFLRIHAYQWWQHLGGSAEWHYRMQRFAPIILANRSQFNVYVYAQKIIGARIVRENARLFARCISVTGKVKINEQKMSIATGPLYVRTEFELSNLEIWRFLTAGPGDRTKRPNYVEQWCGIKQLDENRTYTVDSVNLATIYSDLKWMPYNMSRT